MLAVREVSYRREFGRTLPGGWDHNTKMRYIAYRVWYSCRRTRNVIPACVVKIIRQKFPTLAGMNYIGFHYYDGSDDDETVV